MSFQDAVRSALTQYVTFSGRARRSEYWFFTLFNFLVLMVASFIDRSIGLNSALYGVVALALFLPGLAVLVRRLHDTNRSGWLALLALIPLVGAIVLIVFCVQDSQAGTNQYGPSPKAVTDGIADAAPAV